MFKTINKTVVGLDIGSNAVKMVSLRKNGDSYRVTGAAMSDIKSADDNKNSSKAAIKTAIEECLRSGRGDISRNCRFVSALAGQAVKVSSFNFASLTLEEVPQAVMFEAVQVCPFDIRDCLVDYQLVGFEDAHASSYKKRKKVHPNVKGVLAVATKDAIMEKHKLLEDASLKCAVMDSQGLALLNCLRACHVADEELPVAVVNVGMSLTTVAIQGRDGLPFIRELKYCGSDIIDNIAKDKAVGAEHISHEITDDYKFSVDIAPSCKGLIYDINETFAYYSLHHGSDAIKHIYVCGGFSLLTVFAEVLDKSVGGDVSVLNPFLNMNCDNDIADSEMLGRCGPALAVAVGLAMRQM